MKQLPSPATTALLMRPGQRRLQYSEFGDPKGIPVFYAHGTPGSRLEGLHFEQTARHFGIRLLCLDRPGIGGSDFVDYYNLLDFPRDVTALADHLELEEFGVMGWSSGGPHALTCAYALPERLRFAIVLASYTNFAEFEQARELLWEHDQLAPTIALHSQFLFRTLLGMLRMAKLHAPGLYLDFIKRSAAGRDLEILQDPVLLADFMCSQDEAFRQGIAGVERDLMVEYIDWGYRLEEVQFPVLVLQGREDQFVPWQFAAHLGESLPQAEVEFLDGEGHLFPLDPVWQKQLWKRAHELWQNREYLAPPELRGEENQYREYLQPPQHHREA